MVSARNRVGSQPSPMRHRLALGAALVVGGLLPSVGCQVEYAGMTLPSGKYMHDDVQYFAPGPEMRWANTVAATQRAYMRTQGLDVPDAAATGPIGMPPTAEGALQPSQNIPNMPTNVNVLRSTDRRAIETPPPPAPGMDIPAPPNAGTEPQGPGFQP